MPAGGSNARLFPVTYNQIVNHRISWPRPLRLSAFPPLLPSRFAYTPSSANELLLQPLPPSLPNMTPLHLHLSLIRIYCTSPHLLTYPSALHTLDNTGPYRFTPCMPFNFIYSTTRQL